jgi:hypothetical protein
MSIAAGLKEKGEIIVNGYAEISSNTIITTKGTKDTKKECQYVLSFLRDLRVLRGGITQDRIQLEFSR